MDIEILKIILISIEIPFGFYVIKSINEIKKDIFEHKLHVAQKYLTEEAVREIKDELREIRKDIKNLSQQKH